MSTIGVTLVRRMNAPAQRIYEALTDPAQMAQWWGPRVIKITEVATDLRPGGAWRVAMQGEDGADYIVSGAYIELTPLERVVFSWALTPGSDPPSTVAIQLRSSGGETELTLTHEADTDAAKADRTQGWTRSLLRLERFLMLATT